jgi:hypothetical protein
MSRQKLLDRLRHAGRADDLAREVAAEQAIDLVVTEAKPISIEEAEKRAAAAVETKPAGAAKNTRAAKKDAAAKKGDKKDELWTPDKQAPEGAADKIWTPGS